MSWILVLKILGAFTVAQIPNILYFKLVYNQKVKSFSAIDKSDIEEYDLSIFQIWLKDESHNNRGQLISYKKYESETYSMMIPMLIIASFSIYLSFFMMDKSFFYIGNILVLILLLLFGFMFTAGSSEVAKNDHDESQIEYLDKKNINYDKLFELNKRVLLNCSSLEDFLKKIILTKNIFNSSSYSYRYQSIRNELLPILEEQEYYKKFFTELESSTIINLDLITILVEINDSIIRYKTPFDQVYFKVVDLILEKIDSKELFICNFSWYERILSIINNKDIKLNENSKLNLLSEKVYEKFDFEIKEGVISFSQIYQSIYNLDSTKSYFWNRSFNFVVTEIQKTPDILTADQKKDFFRYIIFSPELFCSLINNEKLIDYPFDLAIINGINNNKWNEYKSCIEQIKNQKIITMLNNYFEDIEDLGFILSEHSLNSNFNMVDYFNHKLNEYWTNYSILVRLDKNLNFKKQMDDKTKRDVKARIAEIERDHLLMEEAKRQSRIKQEELELTRQTYESQRRAEDYARREARNSEIAADNARQAANHARREADAVQREINSRKKGLWDVDLS